MRTFKDTRGRSYYDIVPEIDGQVDITHNYSGTIRGFHYHDKKREWMFAVTGNFKFVLTNPKEVVYVSGGEVIEIAPKRWHAYQALTSGIMMEYADIKFNVEKPDDLKKPYDTFDKWEIEKK